MGDMFRRMAITVHPMGAMLCMKQVSFEAEWFSARRMNLSSVPTFGVFVILTKLFTAYQLWFFFKSGYDIPFGLGEYYNFVETFTLSFCASNILRQACLVLMSNTSHYYGDVTPGGEGVLQQNQSISLLGYKNILALPAQFFCWGFGATHVLHHLVPPQHFLLRTFVYFSVAGKLESGGIRVDDTGSIYRSNRRLYTNESSNSDNFLIQLTGPIWCVACLTIGLLLLPVFDLWIQFVIAKVYGELIIRRVVKGERGGDLYGRRKVS